MGPSGRACVDMDNEENAVKVFDGLNGKIVKGLKIMTVYKKNAVINEDIKTDKMKKSLLQNKKIKKKKDAIQSITEKIESVSKKEGNGKEKEKNKQDICKKSIISLRHFTFEPGIYPR